MMLSIHCQPQTRLPAESSVLHSVWQGWFFNNSQCNAFNFDRPTSTCSLAELTFLEDHQQGLTYQVSLNSLYHSQQCHAIILPVCRSFTWIFKPCQPLEESAMVKRIAALLIINVRSIGVTVTLKRIVMGKDWFVEIRTAWTFQETLVSFKWNFF